MSEIKKLRGAEEGRIETGVVQFGNDWPGIFVRGKHAFDFATRLKQITEDAGYDSGVRSPVLLELIALFESCNTKGKPLE